jgi:hypothetical protein
MPMTIVSRVAARAVISAALAAGSLGLAATAAGACTDSACGGGPPPVAVPLTCTTPDCTRGVPPAAAAMECTDPRCVSGTPPAAVPWPGSRRTGQAGHGDLPARTVGGVSASVPTASAHAGSATAINCPPPHPEVTAPISDC